MEGRPNRPPPAEPSADQSKTRDFATVSATGDPGAGVVPILMRIADSYPPAIAAVQGYIDVPRRCRAGRGSAILAVV
jgi:hypothetical protein